jgi:hypothetical protein
LGCQAAGPQGCALEPSHPLGLALLWALWIHGAMIETLENEQQNGQRDETN